MLNSYRKATHPVHSNKNTYFGKKNIYVFLDSEGLIWTNEGQDIPVKTDIS